MIGSLIAEELSYDYNVSVVDNNNERLEKIRTRNRKIQCLNQDIRKDDVITCHPCRAPTFGLGDAKVMEEHSG